jgi:uncharacterized protein YegL
MRKLPVFVLIDSSSSMRGEAIEAVNTGIKSLLQSLRTNPFALETVYLSVLSFNTEAFVVRSFSDLLNNDLASIEAKGRSNFGIGLDLLMSEMKQRINKTTREKKGDWKPVIIFMTDGRPSGAWKRKIKEFHSLNTGQFIVCACGMKSNLSIVESFGGNTVILNNKNKSSIYEFFKWVSTSISLHSKKIDQNNDEIEIKNKFKIQLD